MAVLLLAALAAQAAHARPEGVASIERELPGAAAEPAQSGPRFAPVDRHRIEVAPRPQWWRITATPDASGTPRVLAVYHPGGTEIEVARPDGTVLARHRSSDPAASPLYSRRALAIPLPATQSPVVLLRATAERERALRVAVLPEAQFRAADRDYLRVMNLVQGVLLAVALTALLFWLRMREPLYGWFALFLLLQMAYLGVVSGSLFEWPGLRSLAALGQPLPWFTATAAGAAGLFFVRDFAELPRHAPWLARTLTAIAWLLVVELVLLLSPWPDAAPWFPLLGNATLVTGNLFVLLALLLAVLRGARPARFVLLALAPAVAMTSLRALQINLELPYPAWLELGMPLAIAFAGIVLTYGMADRLFAVRSERDRALERAQHDALTGALARDAALDVLRRAIAEAAVERAPLSVLFLDLDHFKKVNDRFGHAVGDACLKALVDAIGQHLREDDVVARYGGEEFFVILPGVGAEAGEGIAERIRRQVERDCRQVAGQPVGLTVSIGAASLNRGHDNAHSLIERADEAMYEAKRSGRNRVVVARV